MAGAPDVVVLAGAAVVCETGAWNQRYRTAPVAQLAEPVQVLSALLAGAEWPQLGRSVPQNEREQDRQRDWWAGRSIRELPPLTVEAPGVWHVCGTGRCAVDYELEKPGTVTDRQEPWLVVR
jgi:hypothetical protein